MAFSPMMARLRESATVGTTRKARELKRAGHDVLVISGGEPDFDTPDHIKEAAIRAIRDGDTKYTSTDGTPDLKDAIIAKFARDYDLAVRPEEIQVSAGGKQVIFNAFITTVGPGDEVIIPRPFWVSYVDIVELAGGKPVLLDCREDTGFKLDPVELRRAITPATRWFVINSPCNPTGAVYSADELRAIADALLDHPQVMILTDDIYEHILFDGARFSTMAQIEPRLRDRILTVNGVSKSYCMTGWRIGYGVGPAGLLGMMTRLQGQTTTSNSSVSQAAATAALLGPHDFIGRHNASYQRRRDLVVGRINQIAGLTCVPPQGAFYVYVNAVGLLGQHTPSGQRLKTDVDIADHMLSAGGVAVVPGVGFGLSPYFRLCFAYADDVLTDACNRIAHAVSVLSAA